MGRIAWVLLVGLLSGLADPYVAWADARPKSAGPEQRAGRQVQAAEAVRTERQAAAKAVGRRQEQERARRKRQAARDARLKRLAATVASRRHRDFQSASDLHPRFAAVGKGVGFWRGALHTAAGPVRMQVLKVDLRLADVAPVVARSGSSRFGLERTSSMGARVGAIAGINGSFFSPRNRQPVDLLVVNGRTLSAAARRPAFVLKPDGTASIVASRRARESAIMHAVGGGPTLLSHGRMSLAGWPRSIGGRAPRTAAGLTWDGKVLLLTIDGRSRGSVGATIREEARYMAALGASDAINLDGGGSSTMVVGGRVVNSPSDGFERSVSNALMVFPKRAVAVRPQVPRRTPYSGYHVDRS